MTKKCFFRNCSKNSNADPNLKFFHFPKNRGRICEWINACNNIKLRKLSHLTIQKKCFVCSTHFKRTDFLRILTPLKDKLKRNVTPTIDGMIEQVEDISPHNLKETNNENVSI